MRTHTPEALTAAGYVATGIWSWDMPGYARIRRALIELNLAHGSLTAFRMTDGEWELYRTPQATPGFTDLPLLSKVDDDNLIFAYLTMRNRWSRLPSHQIGLILFRFPTDVLWGDDFADGFRLVWADSAAKALQHPRAIGAEAKQLQEWTMTGWRYVSEIHRPAR